MKTGDVIDYTPGADVSAGDIIVQGELIGQVVCDTLSGTQGALRIEGVITLPKLTTDVVTVGAILYWDADNDRCTLTAGELKIIGKAVSAAGNGATEVDVKLTPGAITPVDSGGE